MDLLREGYKTRMRFFRESTEETEVVWYPVPASRPILPYATAFHSWEWEEENSPFTRFPGTTGIGEQVTAQRNYGKRIRPPYRPFRGHICGTEDQWRRGEALPPDPPVPVLPDRFPACCGPALRRRPNIFDCGFQLRAIWTINLIGTNPAAVTGFIRSSFDADLNTVMVNAPAGIVPSTVVAWNDDYRMLFLFGTRNSAQWATQLAPAGNGPTDFGRYSTHPLHQLSMRVVLGRFLADDGDHTLPVVIAGHSYGGSVGLLVALELQTLYPLRDIQCYTFGCPKMGDARLFRLLSPLKTLNHVNFDDPIPRLPPGGTEAALVAPIVGVGIATNWARFMPPPNQTGILANGFQYRNPDLRLGPALLAAVAVNFALGRPLGAFSGHFITTYYERIFATCDNPPPVVVAEVHGGGTSGGKAATAHSVPFVVLVHGGAAAGGKATTVIPRGVFVHGGAAAGGTAATVIHRSVVVHGGAAAGGNVRSDRTRVAVVHGGGAAGGDVIPRRHVVAFVYGGGAAGGDAETAFLPGVVAEVHGGGTAGGTADTVASEVVVAEVHGGGAAGRIVPVDE